MSTHPAVDAAPPLPATLLRLARWVRAGAVLGAGFMALVPPVFWLSPDWVRAAAPGMANIAASAITIDGRAQVLGLLASLPAMAVGLWMMGRLWRLFDEFVAGRVFGAAALLALRGFARALLVSALLVPVQRTLLALVLTLGNPPGQRLLVIGLDWSDYQALLLGGTLLAMAAVMAEAAGLRAEAAGLKAEAARLKAENDAFV